ncbi:MAG: UTP--glucose-1-phosphate uridylyltransferase GalU [Candidatus Latescibacteria bacterium]|nr:UTP--glucose-1-phosphate uridylyltransferase GalU [Candidatus Latescibacterota bacterium]
MRIRKAVIPAAGHGSRMLPATKALPKEMMPIVDKPAIQYIIEELVDAGIEDILIITGRGKRAIEDHFDRNIEIHHALREREDHPMLETLERIEAMADIHYVRQKEPLGTGHAILKARKHIGDEPFAVLYGDDLVVSERPCVGQLMDQYEKYSASILAVKEVPPERISSYGVIRGKRINDVYLVNGLVEKPDRDNAPSNLATLGRYIFEPEIFDFLERIAPAPSGEYQLTDAIEMMIQSRAVYACAIEGEWHTVGDLLSYLKTTVAFSLRHPAINEDFREFLTSNGWREPSSGS